MKVIDQEVYIVTNGKVIRLQQGSSLLTESTAKHLAFSLNFAREINNWDLNADWPGGPKFEVKKAKLLLEIED